MNQTAQHLASQGRYGDSMLVHMSPQEVSGLQSLARNNGTTMTINPSTGLPEAFSLRNLLPMIAGFALGPAGLGLSALQAGMITGGLGALATGSLGKGVLMGLGAAGGAGLAGSAANLASPAATSGAGATSSTLGASGMGGAGTGVTVPSSAMQGSSFGLPSPTSTVGLNAKNLALPPIESGAYGLTSSAPTNISAYAPPPSALAPTTTSAYSQLPAASSGSLTAPSSMTTLSPAPSISERFATNFGRAMEGGGKAFSSSDAAMDFLGSNKMNLAMAAAPSMIPETPRLPRSESYIRPYSLDVENLSDLPVSPTGVEEERLRYRYTAGEPYRAAQGGIIAFAEGGNTTDGMETYTNPAMMTPPQYMQVQPFAGIEGYSYAEGGETKRRDVRKRIDRMDDPYTFAAYQSGRGLYDAALQNFAEGGLSNVPRFLSGGGDGMSDSIPATINNRQPARLADGEFVIPADVVSHLGNGSSKAGAKQLYSMMDRVRSKRTGKKKQAPAVNPKKMMPA
jgi:hypothetical protein